MFWFRLVKVMRVTQRSIDIYLLRNRVGVLSLDIVLLYVCES